MRILFGILLFCLIGGNGKGQRVCQDSVAACMQRLVAAQEDSLKLKYSDEMAGWIARLERGTYDVSSGVQYLGYKRCLNAEAELFPGVCRWPEVLLFTIISVLKIKRGMFC